MGGEPGLEALLNTAREAAEAATTIQRRDAGTVRLGGAREKARSDYVTTTDLDAQAAALCVIERNHPDHLVLAEESEEPVEDRLAHWDGRPLWIVDPLDGTANFLHSHPQYCASVAVAVEGRIVAGAVTCGSSGERWWAAERLGAFKSGRRIRVSSVRAIRQAMVGTGFPFKHLEFLPEYLGELDRVLCAASGVRRGGSAALDLAHLAQGSLDAFWESSLMPWDFCAGLVLVREAGGAIRGADGAALGIAPGPVYGANSEGLLDELRAVLSGDDDGTA